MSTGEPVRRFLDPGSGPLLASATRPRPALFLDRDGVINENLGYVHTPAETRWVPGIFEFARRATDAGFLLVVVTNQAGIARGLYSEEQFLEYTGWMHGRFAERGTPLLATYYCPHHPSAGVGAARRDCDCRKPRPGMLLAAIRELELEPASSVMIGDSASDMLAAGAAGIGRSLLLSGEDGAAVGKAIQASSLEQLSGGFEWPR